MTAIRLQFIVRIINLRDPGGSRVCIISLLSLATSAFMLTGCTLLPMRNLQPVIAPPAGACARDLAILPHEKLSPGKLHYVLPSDVVVGGLRQVATEDTFEKYSKAIQVRVASKLPSDLAHDRVTIAFLEFFASVSAEAQLDAQVAVNNAQYAEKIAPKINPDTVTNERAAIQKFNRAPNLKHSELKDFAKKLFDLQLKHGPADFLGISLDTDPAVLGPRAHALAAARPKLDADLLAYLKAYYDGTFNDRMGTTISKPQLPSLSTLTNFSVPDAEIVAAETVLIEFIIDCIDPTPVMGDSQDGLPADTINYYPGGSTNEPTAWSTGLASYVQLPQKGCGITQANAWVLKDLATGVSDQVATIGGLVVNTPGGISVGLGVLGKISIGDNQTLSDLLKTAVSELALRATLGTSYFTLRNVTFNPPQP